ncbi:unnamed protein product [Tilletia controversa]|uniref:Mitochondrial presequence protease n=3 Tax=Tilletia TaxID=13289 RepID=A0A8X7MPV8_9BASI|nr:hypothetical protein CF336_g5240 [Tilletia laevis]KAE8193968.1 hypothetical protein CF328_g4888 [Tilletia controversa]KAE8258022.1 hypothetical protein A4X03_0g4507 [Tilletia caries]KAE8197772.1 hypothetical protein CF335_g4541 [Tilletia laevis]KAE8245305.1 hypothetical protein A4X06_0g5745 [Tilletia controversa]
MSQPASAANASAQSHGNFHLLKSLALPYAPTFTIEKWVSSKTGLTLYWVNFDSPLLNLYITLATEIFNDSGVPHTLEHLIFLGSEKYPYKGVLDSLANRAFAQGTNAWTANDHTAYTLTTAGPDGFLRMLPIYLDHVFFPTLTDSGFVTEVYHVTPQGTDSGVVYSEMQGRENSSGDLIELAGQRLLYPPTSAYRSETGGLMSALRVLTPQTIRDYHKSHYASHNAAVIICGRLDRESLLSTMEEVEKSLEAHGQTHGVGGPDGWKRPFLETASATPPTIDGSHKPSAANIKEGEVDLGHKNRNPLRRRADVLFPEKDESMGEVQITWMGPGVDNFLESDAIDTLATYLTDSAVSTLQKAFVERDDPLCTDVYIGENDRAGKTSLYAYFSSVPAAELDNLDEKLIDVLKRHTEEGFDMDRMRIVLERERLKLLNDLETKPADSLGDFIIRDFLYGARDGSQLEPAVDDLTRIDTLLAWSAAQWADLLRQYFIDNSRLVVVGRPSAALAKKLKADTRSRVDERKRELGPDGLNKLKEKLEAAQRENDKDIPDEMLRKFKVPDPASIQWIPVGTGKNYPTKSAPVVTGSQPSDLDAKVQAHLDADGEPLPFYSQFDHTSSNFVIIAATFSTANLPAELRPLLSLYLSAFFTLPVTRFNVDGTKTELGFEEVVKMLDKDTVMYDIGLGESTGFTEHIEIVIKAEKNKYEGAIAWLRDLLWNSHFSIERLRISASKLLQSLPESKRDGSRVSWALLRQLLYDNQKASNVAVDLLSRITSIPELVDQLTKDGDKVAASLAQLRDTVLVPDNMRVAVCGDVLGLSEPRTAWKKQFCKADWVPKEPQRIQWSKDVLSDLGKQPARSGLICSLPTIESSYAVFTAKCMDSYDHPDYPALTATLAVLNAMESYLWRFIRGAGLAYGASIRDDLKAGHIHFALYRSPDAAKAFLAAKDVIDKLASGAMTIDETTLESAKSSVTLSIAEDEGTVGSAAMSSFNEETMLGIGKGRGRRLLLQLNTVTIADVQRTLQTYIVPLFDPATSVCAIASAPQQAKGIRESLSSAGYEITERTIATAGDEDEDGSEGSEDDDDESDSDDMSEDDSEKEGSQMST